MSKRKSRMRPYRFVFLVGLLVITTGFLPVPQRLWDWIKAGNDADDTRVLFIGNSFTFTHDVPGIVQDLSASGGRPRSITVGRAVHPNATLEWHWNNGKTLETMRNSSWDYVVLQEQSVRPMFEFDLMQNYAVLFDQAIRKSGAKTLLFLTWADANRPGDQAVLSDAYYTVAQNIGAEVVPVGLAWEYSISKRPDIALHADDQHHPSPLGAYLTACVFTSAISGADSLELPAEVRPKPQRLWQLLLPSPQLPVKSDVGFFLQQVAQQAVTGQRCALGQGERVGR